MLCDDFLQVGQEMSQDKQSANCQPNDATTRREIRHKVTHAQTSFTIFCIFSLLMRDQKALSDFYDFLPIVHDFIT